MSNKSAIGQAALYVGLDATKFERGMKSLHKAVMTGIGDLQGVIGGGISVGVKALGVGLAGIGVAGAAGLGAFTAATLEAKAKMEELNKVSKAATAFGLGSSEGTGLFGLMAQAGSDVRDASEGLVTLGARVRDALSGSGEEAADLFKGLNVSAEKFQGLNPSDQFYLLVDSLNQVQDPATRVGLLLKAVGEDTGKNLMPLLGKTGAEARAMAAGFSVSAAEMSKMAGASSAVSRMESVFERLKTKLAVAASPFIQSVASAFDAIDVDAMGRKFTRVYEIATDVFERLRAFAADVFAKLSADFDSFIEKSVKPAVAPQSPVNQFGQHITAFGTSVAKFAESTGSTLGSIKDGWNGMSHYMSSGLANMVGSGSSLLGRITGDPGLKSMGKSLLKDGQQFKRQGEQDWEFKTAERWGAVGKGIGQVAGDAVAAAVNKALTPTVKLNETAIDYAMSAIEGAEMAIKNVEQMALAKPDKPMGANTGFVAGTAEELAFRLRAMSPVGDIAKQHLDISRRQLAEDLKLNQNFERWVQNTRPYSVAD